MHKKNQALLLIAHGSSMPNWSLSFNNLVDKLIDKYPQQICQLAFLEKSEPNIQTAVDNLQKEFAVRGIKVDEKIDINVVPLFFAKSVHTNGDIPRIITQCQEKYPQIDFNILPALLDEPKFTELFNNYLATNYFEVNC